MYLYLTRDDKTFGPYSPGDFVEFLNAGHVKGDDVVQLQSGWLHARDLEPVIEWLARALPKSMDKPAGCVDTRQSAKQVP